MKTYQERTQPFSAVRWDDTPASTREVMSVMIGNDDAPEVGAALLREMGVTPGDYLRIKRDGGYVWIRAALFEGAYEEVVVDALLS